jgi:hypothetical protein
VCWIEEDRSKARKKANGAPFALTKSSVQDPDEGHPQLCMCSFPIKPIFVAPSRCADASTAATALYGASLFARRWISD